jgi:hypothetical protein
MRPGQEEHAYHSKDSSRDQPAARWWNAQDGRIVTHSLSPSQRRAEITANVVSRRLLRELRSAEFMLQRIRVVPPDQPHCLPFLNDDTTAPDRPKTRTPSVGLPDLVAIPVLDTLTLHRQYTLLHGQDSTNRPQLFYFPDHIR